MVAKFDGPSGSSLVFTSSSERCSVKLHYWGIIPAPMRHGWIFSPSQTYKLAPNFSLNMVFLIWQIRQDRWPIFGNFHSKQASYSLWKTSCRVCVCLCFKSRFNPGPGTAAPLAATYAELEGVGRWSGPGTNMGSEGPYSLLPWSARLSLFITLIVLGSSIKLLFPVDFPALFYTIAAAYGQLLSHNKHLIIAGYINTC